MITIRTGSVGEAFLTFEQENDDIHYLTDTGRTWSNRHTLRDVMRTKTQKKDHPLSLDTTDDLMNWLPLQSEQKLYITVHPERLVFKYR